MKTLFKGVSGEDLGGTPFWQSGPLWTPGGECFAPLGALPFEKGEGARSTLLHWTQDTGHMTLDI